jgi:RecA-family ATPase
MSTVTGLTGDGGMGKTQLALQLAHATVRGTDWLGGVIDEAGPVIFFSAEEDYDEVHRRLHAIVAHFGTGFDALADLHLLCLPGDDAVLGVADRSSIVRATPLLDALQHHAVEVRPALIIIETAADVFAGNESDRSAVRQFIGLLRRLAIKSGAAVLLLSHPSLTGLATGSGTSGTTGWNNALRSRMNFTSKADDDVRELAVVKSNYGPIGETVRLRWQHGVFVPVPAGSTLDTIAADAKADQLFVALLERHTEQGQRVSTSTGTTYAPAKFAEHPDASGVTSKVFAKAMQRLLDAGKIRIEEDGPASRRRSRLVTV